MKSRLRYTLLLAVKYLTRVFYRHEMVWLHPEPEPPWDDLRVVAILNHTSLYEWLFTGLAPNHLLKSIAYRAIIPAADVTMKRAWIGTFLSGFAPDVISITREKDETWAEVLRRVGPGRIVVILPEGRMKRADGRDKYGRPMTVRGGIADILRGIDGGRMLLAYSGGLHHIQVPGQGAPKLFKPVRMAVELVDIDAYKQALGGGDNRGAFKKAVVDDLARRRDLHCPPLGRD